MFKIKSKTLVVFCLFIISLNLLACKKKGEKTMGWSTASIDNKEWKSSRAIYSIIFDSILAFNFSKGYYDSDNYFHVASTLRYNAVKKKIGRQYLNQIPFLDMGSAALGEKPFVYFNYYLQSGDELCSGYMPWAADSLNNWVEIDKVEGNFDKIWGSYSITMIPDTSWRSDFCDRNIYGDTIRIRNGRFYTERNYP